jgi:hypothetical protein
MKPQILTSLLISSALLLAPTAASAKRPPKAKPAPAAPEAYDAPPPAAPPVEEPAPATPPPADAVPAPTVNASATPAAPEIPRKRLGVGYHIGNGWGFVGGDVIVQVVDHLTLDLMVNRLSVDAGGGQDATGWAFGGEAQLHLKEGWQPSFYLGLGISRGSLSLEDVTASGVLTFANVGYDIRLANGLGILIGCGVQHLGTVHGSSAQASIDVEGYTSFNLEAGLRFMFL